MGNSESKPTLQKHEELGRGAYGVVHRATYRGETCAAKILYPFLILNYGGHFQRECDILRSIEHVNIVRYVDVYNDPVTDEKALLIELMEMSLRKYLEKIFESLSLNHQLNLLHNICSAVAYLHSKGIVHRDLSDNNVLLSGDVAKVCDFGMSRLFDVKKGAADLSKMTRVPGTPNYMPPEAVRDPPKYSEKLDCFSIGVLGVQIITRKCPEPGPSTKPRQDSSSATGEVHVPISEIERRKSHLDLIAADHPLKSLLLQCLRDNAKDRPTADRLCSAADFKLKDWYTIRAKTVKRNVLILGKTGDGKSAIANRILGREVFKVSDDSRSVTNAVQAATAIHHIFDVKVIDTPGLFHSSMPNKEIIQAVKTYVKTHIPEGIHLILTTRRSDCRLTNEDKVAFDTIISSLSTEASCISALIITGCEMKSSKARARLKRICYEDRTRDIASYMKKGLYCVGFADRSDDHEEICERRAKQDTETLRELIYACDVPIRDIFRKYYLKDLFK